MEEERRTLSISNCSATVRHRCRCLSVFPGKSRRRGSEVSEVAGRHGSSSLDSSSTALPVFHDEPASGLV